MIGKVLAHELTHYIEEWNPKGYAALQKYIIEAFNRENPDGFDARVRQYMNEYEIEDLNEARNEVIADSCEMLLRDSNVVTQMVQENRSLAEKVKGFLDKFIARIKKALSDIYDEQGEYSEVAKDLRKIVGDMTEIQKLWDAGLKGALEENAKPGRARRRKRERVKRCSIPSKRG